MFCWLDRFSMSLMFKLCPNLALVHQPRVKPPDILGQALDFDENKLMRNAFSQTLHPK